MPVAQGPEGWGALSISAPFCYTLIKPPPLFTEQRGKRISRKLEFRFVAFSEAHIQDREYPLMGRMSAAFARRVA
jgi:hypothetical protein